MSPTDGKSTATGYRSWTALLIVVLAIAFPSCRRQGPATSEAVRGQTTFSSPQDAANALVEAAKNDNQQQMLAIFGPEFKDVIFTGNAAEDKASFTQFVSAYGHMNRWRRIENGNELLLVGVSNTAFPIPLKKGSSGKWFFDTAMGKDELINRQLGRNELANIDVCGVLRVAELEYYEQAHDGQKQYARKFISDPGKQNGLYWPEEPGKPKSPLGPLVAYATAEGNKAQPSLHKPFYGYYYEILVTQGPYASGGLRDYTRGGIMNRGFGFVAYPAKYGVTGVMTFIVSQEGVVYQKDLGAITNNVAPFMRQFNPDPTWAEVKDY